MSREYLMVMIVCNAMSQSLKADHGWISIDVAFEFRSHQASITSEPTSAQRLKI